MQPTVHVSSQTCNQYLQFLRHLARPFFVAGIGTAFAFIPISVGVLTGVTERDAGVAPGLLSTSRNLGGVIGVIGVAVASSIAASHFRTLGPLVSEEQLTRVSGYLESGKAEGATALTGGGRFGDRGFFIEPTLLINTHGNMKVVREEIFGPVVVAAPFSDLDEIAAQANDSEYGLGAGIWTKDISKAHTLAKKLRAGTVWINCYNVFDAALPFGGYKQSGWGREMGHEVLEAYTEVKAVTTQL